MNLFKYKRLCQYFFNALILCLTFSSVCSCGDDDNEPMDEEDVLPPENNEENDDEYPSEDDFLAVVLPELSDVEVSEVDYYGTTISAIIYSDGGDSIIERGFCLSSTSKSATTKDQKIVVESDSYKLSTSLTEFAEITTYYVRAYAINSKGTAYSESVASFLPDLIQGHKFVDLGLSTMWATCDVGAESPEETGGNYAWGETYVKSNYTASNYQYRYRTKIGSSYYDLYSLYGPIGGTQRDVAYQEWGYQWCMPTPKEIQELIDNCTWKSTTKNGVKGCTVTGPNGNSIFLHQGNYWSDNNILSGSYGSSNSVGYYLRLTSNGKCSCEEMAVYLGMNVRPVVR